MKSEGVENNSGCNLAWVLFQRMWSSGMRTTEHGMLYFITLNSLSYMPVISMLEQQGVINIKLPRQVEPHFFPLSKLPA
jgi:hypothetical protein